ncbi:MAG: putative secreted protein [Clostridia bacterium]|nr:putative secreted protein [Clostridia bacterium]
MKNHLGYRFVLRKSDIPDEIKKGEELSFNGIIENVGFGNVVKNKLSEIIFKNEKETFVFNMDIDVTKWLSKTKNEYLYKMIIPQDFSAGKYEIYLRIRTPSKIDTNYSIRFANNDIWNDAISANFIGTVIVK